MEPKIATGEDLYWDMLLEALIADLRKKLGYGRPRLACVGFLSELESFMESLKGPS